MKVLKIILELIYYIFYFMVISYTLYYVFTGLCVVFNKKNKIKRYKEKTKFARLIPARNEEVVIKQLISSLKKQNYSKELYDIFVIPNNCTDNTKQIAKDEGANIIECDVEVTKKGDALKYAFNYLMNEFPEYDAYCIFDADNIVHPDFLKRMNDAYISGYNVAQGFRDCKNPKDSWISSCYSLFYFIQNFFFSQARTNIGLSASINGTGFMVAKSVIKKYGFDTITLTEDVEFSAQCALNGVKIGFVKDAITYDEQPAKFTQSWKQRKRWSVGTMQCLKIYSGKLFKESIKKKKLVCFDMSIYYMAPIMQILSFGLILAVLFIRSVWYSNIRRCNRYSKYISISYIWIFSKYFCSSFCFISTRKECKTVNCWNNYVSNIFLYLGTNKFNMLSEKTICVGTNRT